MPLHETDAFVLRTFSLREADKICVFFTRQAGKLRGVAHGARRLKSKYGASLEPFTEVELTYFQQEHRELVSVSNCEIVTSQFYEGLSSELLGVLHYLSELVDCFAPDHEPSEKTYRLIGATLAALRQADQEQLPILVRYFETWLLKLAGFFPDWQHCGVCARDLTDEAAIYLTNEGVPQCAECSGRRGEELSQMGWRTIKRILTQPPDKFLAATHDAHLLNQIGNLTTRLIERALERALKSYEVLDRLRPAEMGVGG